MPQAVPDLRRWVSVGTGRFRFGRADGEASTQAPPERPPAFRPFAADRLRIVDQRGEVVPLALNWAQRQVYGAELRLRREGRRPWLLILKDRKSGVSTLQQALAYYAIRTQPNSECRTIAHTDTDTRRLFGMVERFYRSEPADGRRPDKAAGSTYAIRFPRLGSVYDAVTAGATATGRGGTLHRIHCSEVAFYPDAATLHTALADGQAVNASYVWESTPNGRDGRGKVFYETYEAAKRGKNLFTPLFFPWWSHPANRERLTEPDELFPLDDEERYRQQRYGLDLQQIKYWRQKRLALSLSGRGIAAMTQEHPDNDVDCFLESGEPYFDRDLLALRRTEQVRDPIRFLQGGMLHGMRIYAEPDPEHEYTIGCDPAEGVERDDSAISVMDHTTGAQVAAWNRDDMDPNTLGREVLPAAGEMYRGSSVAAFAVVERNNHGHAVLGAALTQGYPNARLYHHAEATDPRGRTARRVGWPNTSATKGVLVADLGTSLVEGAPRVLDAETQAGIRRIERGPNGVAELTGRDLAVAHALSMFRAPPPAVHLVTPGTRIGLAV